MIDMSILGVGLELFGSLAQDLAGKRVVVQVQAPVGASITFRLVGVVRNMSLGSIGGTRVGIESVGLSDTEQKILRVMELMQVVW